MYRTNTAKTTKTVVLTVNNPKRRNAIMRRLAIRKGDTYGEWTVIKEIKQRGNRRYFLCKCSCGSDKEVYLGHLRNGASTKCNTCKGSYLSAANRKDELLRHDNPLYWTFSNMKQRCAGTHSGSASYIAKGITVEWSDFESFYAWANDKYFNGSVLHRVDDSKGYRPDNCEFISKSAHMKIHKTKL